MTLLLSASHPIFFVAVIIFHLATLIGQEEILSAEERMAELRSSIARHNWLYHEVGRPVISDAAYDRLVDELALLERENPVADQKALADVVPASTAAANSPRGNEHRISMLGLEKAYSLPDVANFHDKVVQVTGDPLPEFCVEPKIDGMAVSLVYIRGRFARALTRGNGHEGQDVSDTIRVVDGFRETLVQDGNSVAPAYLELRGEVFIRPSDFMRINADRMASGETPFTTERNLAAGTALADDSKLALERCLSLMVFDWGAWEPEALRPPSQEAFLDRVRSWGLSAIEPFGSAAGMERLSSLIDSAEARVPELDLPLDGFVLKVNDADMRTLLGRGNSAPNWALAFKPRQPEISTELLEVVFQVSRTGRLNPVALLKPVRAGGREISRATLHNWPFIREHDLRLGDTLVLEVSGDVIPRISGLKAKESHPESLAVPFPGKCPECAAAVEYTGEMNFGYCRAADCPGRLREQIVHFGRVLGINGLGPQTARRLVDYALVKGPGDLYLLESKQAEVKSLLGEATAVNLIEAVQRSRARPFDRYLQALGIPGIGPAGAREVAKVFDSWSALLQWKNGKRNLDSMKLERRLAEKLRDFLKQPEAVQVVRQFANLFNSRDR